MESEWEFKFDKLVKDNMKYKDENNKLKIQIERLRQNENIFKT